MMSKEQIGINELKVFFKEFYKGYFQEYLMDKNKELPSYIGLETSFEKDLGFDWEAYDYFIGELAKRYNIDYSDFYINTHTEGMSFIFSYPLTRLFRPFIGVKKWMAFEKEARVPLRVKNVLQALKVGKLSSLEIFKDSERNESQEKVYKLLGKAKKA